MSKQRKILEAAYQAAKEAGDMSAAGCILIQLSSPFPCTCTEEFLNNNHGTCHCDRYASLLRPVTPQELMLGGC